MNKFETELKQGLEKIRGQGLYRELRRIDSPQGVRIDLEGRTHLNFSSNDYLGLANEPALKEAAIRAVEKFGAGSGASRLICGSLAPHQELEEMLACFKGTAAALTFSSGYAAALGTICVLLGKDDVIIIDRLCHACLVDAAKLSGAKLRVFAHNDLNSLEHILKRIAGQRAAGVPPAEAPSGMPQAARFPRILIVTESLFSMDGDQVQLRDLVELKDRYGVWLMVDEAHATGLYGPRRRGLAEARGVSDRIEIQMGTLGKALGAAGGFVCGSRALIDYLINRARSFIFSTAPTPAAAAAASAGVAFTQSSEGSERCAELWRRVGKFSAAGWCPPSRVCDPETSQLAECPADPGHSPIIPLIVGDETRAVEAAAGLRAEGMFVPAIRYPTVARGAARLRVTVTAAHTSDDIDKLGFILTKLGLVPHSALRTPHSNEQVR
jgi:7-keto-8-aminopelargonate synthetase-like enzyme